MICKNSYCYNNKLVKYNNMNICDVCLMVYEKKCDICGLICKNTCLDMFSNALKIIED